MLYRVFGGVRGFPSDTERMSLNMEIRLLYGNELQIAVYTAHETFERCIRPYVRSQREIDRYYHYVNVEYLWQEMSAGRLFLWGAFENGQMCAVSAMQSNGHITMLYVKPYCQRRKIGEQLVNHMCAYAANILHRERVTIQVTPVSMAAFFYHIGFTLIQGAPLENEQVPLERRIWMAPVYQVYAPQAPKKPEVTYSTKKVSNKVIVGLVVATLVLCFGITTALTVHHMATEGLHAEYEIDDVEEMDETLMEELGDPEEV